MTHRTTAKAKILAGDDLAALFDLDMADTVAEPALVKEGLVSRSGQAIQNQGSQAGQQTGALPIECQPQQEV